MKYAVINTTTDTVEIVGHTDNPSQYAVEPCIVVFSEDEYEVGWSYNNGEFLPPAG